MGKIKIVRKNERIYLMTYRNYKRLLVTTGRDCPDSHWSEKNQDFKNTNLGIKLRGLVNKDIEILGQLLVNHPWYSELRLVAVVAPTWPTHKNAATTVTLDHTNLIN